MLELPVAHCSQRVAKEPNEAGTHLIAWKDSELQLLLQTGNRVYELWDSTIDMKSVREYSTSFYAFLSYSKLSSLTCTGVWRISPKHKGPLGMAAEEAMFTFPTCASPPFSLCSSTAFSSSHRLTEPLNKFALYSHSHQVSWHSLNIRLSLTPFTLSEMW